MKRTTHEALKLATTCQQLCSNVMALRILYDQNCSENSYEAIQHKSLHKIQQGYVKIRGENAKTSEIKRGKPFY